MTACVLGHLTTNKIRSESLVSFSLPLEITNSSNKKKRNKLNSTSVLTPGLAPSHSGSPFSGAVCSTALQMRGANPCAGTHRSSLPSLPSLLHQSSPGDGAQSAGRAESNPAPGAPCSSSPGSHSPSQSPTQPWGHTGACPARTSLKECHRHLS